MVYAIAAAGMFAALTQLGSRDRELDRVDELSGIGFRRPIAAACLAVFVFSLAGIPPLAGFWGKLILFWETISFGLQSEASAMSFWFVTLAVVGVVNAAISAGYYLRIVATMYFPSSVSVSSVVTRDAWGASGAMVICAVLVILAGIVPGRLMGTTEAMSRSASIVTTTIDRLPKSANLPTPHPHRE